MPRFRKKPVEVEAVRYTGTADSAQAVLEWTRGKPFVEPDDQPGALTMSLKINTLEGVMKAAPGDWVIRGVKGEFYPCKPDIFEATYDRVEEPDANLATHDMQVGMDGSGFPICTRCGASPIAAKKRTCEEHWAQVSATQGSRSTVTTGRAESEAS